MPFPNVFGCRLQDPTDFEQDTFRTMTRKHEDKEYQVIVAKKKGGDTMSEQSFRYEKSIWAEESAKIHCQDHGGSFIAAGEGDNAMDKGQDAFKGFEIKSKVQDAEIWLYDEIGGGGWFSEGISAKKFADDLNILGKLNTITLRINSPGGDVFDGIAIYNILKQNSARVIVNIDGLAASIASVIAMAGDEIHMADNALMMVHNAWTMGMGNSTDLREIAARLDKVDGSIQTTYMKKTGLDHTKVVDLMHAETWMSAKEALDLGFIDNIGEPLQMAAHFDMSRFNFKKNPPAARVPMHPQAVEPDKPEPMPPDVSCFDQAISRCKAILDKEKA